MRTLRWGDIATLRYGKGLREYPSSPSESHSFRVFGTNGPIGWHSKPLVNAPGIIVGRKGAYRGVHFSSAPFYVIDTAYYLDITDPNIDLKWAYYKLLTVDINRMDSGSAIPSTSRSDFEAIVVQVPEKSVQKRITQILAAYDDLIENNRRRMELLEASARHLYEEWFVRLRFPGHEHTKIVDGVPDGWSKLKVLEVFEVNPRTTLAEKREHAWVEMSDLQPNSMVVENCMQREGRSGSKFQNGDTLVARITPCLENGKTAFVDFLEPGEVGRGSTEFIVLRPKLVGPEFVYCFARTYAFREHAIKSMRGASGRQRVQESSLHDFPVLLPPASLQKVFEEHARVAFRLVRLLQRENERLKSARDILLPRLMSGEVAV